MHVTARLKLGDKVIQTTAHQLLIKSAGVTTPLNGELSLPAVPPGLYQLELTIEDELHKGAACVVRTNVKIGEN